jgi:type 1 glutamine amidotransferase
MTLRTNGWLSRAAWFGALATMGSACTGTPLDFESGSAGAGGDSAAGGSGGSDAAGIGSAGESDATGGTGGSDVTGGIGGSDVTGGAGESDATGGTGGSDATGGTGGSDATGGTGTISGTGGALGGSGGALVGTAGATAGSAGADTTGAYAPRSGPFKALVYSKTSGYRHQDSIEAGHRMFAELASQFDFEVTDSEDFSFTAENLASYELVVFLNTSGNPFDPDEKVAFEEWMVSKHGAFVGTHSAADTENGWPFYSELTGQYYNRHTLCCAENTIAWEPDALDFPGVKGLPSPWRRSEEWFHFDDFPQWSTKPGFKILSTVQIDGVTHPVSFAREFMNFRSFYTSLGHQSATFEDALVQRHIAGGLLWAVRREHLLD